jgi:alpha-glucosidase
MEHKWWREAVVYQLYPKSFMDSNGDGIGDLPGILSRLDYLQWLGIDCIWLCPIFASPNEDNGYDIADYQAIMAEFGTLADFERLLAEVHRRGMRLILDLVPNHTSDAHPWFQESRASRSNTRRDWYYWREGRDGGPPNNWEGIFGGPAWEFDPATGQYYLHLFTRRQPDLHWDNPAVREAISAVARWWLDKGVDGFRIDAVTHLKKAPGLPDMPHPAGRPQVPAWPLHMNVPGVLDHVDDLCRAAFHGRDILTVGEANGVGAEAAEAWVGPRHRRLSMLLHFEHWQLWSDQPGAPLDVRALKRILGRWQRALDGRGWNALYLENTELPRVVSRWGDLERYRRESATALATAYFLMQGSPFIYQGQELGLANPRFGRLEEFRDVCARRRIEELRAAGMSTPQGRPEEGSLPLGGTARSAKGAPMSDEAILAELQLTSRDNARVPMPWDDGPRGGFTTGMPWLWAEPADPAANVAREQADPDSVLHYYRRLIGLRRAEPLLVYGRYVPLAERSRQLLAYTREGEGGRIAVICNLSAGPARYRHGAFALRHEHLLLANRPVTPHPALHALSLAPFEARVYRLD